LLLKGVDLHLNTKYDSNYHKGKKIIYTGNIDGYYDYMFGRLEYRTLNFIEKTYNTDNHQGVSVINYTDNTPYTRSIEHRHFDNNCKAEQTIVSYEYSSECKGDDIPYYPIETKTNLDILKKYKDHHKKY
jgi:UDP-galactopyranose mutase